MRLLLGRFNKTAGLPTKKNRIFGVVEVVHEGIIYVFLNINIEKHANQDMYISYLYTHIFCVSNLSIMYGAYIEIGGYHV